MTPEAMAYLEKARKCLSNAHASLGIGLSNDAGRSAYLAAFHTSQALIFERTGKAAKTHQGVQSELHPDCLALALRRVLVADIFI